MPIMCEVGSFGLFLQALQSAFKHFPPSDYNFLGLQLVCCRKEWSSGLVTSQRKVENRKVRHLSNSHPHAEQLVRRICGHQTLSVIWSFTKANIKRFSCFLTCDPTNTLRNSKAGSFGASLPMAAERYHVHILTLALPAGIRTAQTICIDLMILYRLWRPQSVLLKRFELFWAGRDFLLE